jgi:hypothetical protein
MVWLFGKDHRGVVLEKLALRQQPPISVPVRMLIRILAEANPLWRAPRIHGELLKLGIAVSERTVSRILQTIKRPPSQTWRTFLRNHLGEIVAVDLFTVPTIRLRALFVFLVIEHQRRRVLHFGVTEHPTAEWTGQQMAEAFSERVANGYLIRDRDSIYGNEFRRRVYSLAMKEMVTAPRSPWQNAFAERLIGSSGMPGSYCGSESAAPSSSPEELFRLLPLLADAPGLGQGRPRQTGRHAERQNRRHSAGRRLAPPL